MFDDVDTCKVILKKLDCFVFADLFESEITQYADLMIPMSTFAETNGSFTSGLRAVNPVRRAIPPINGMENWEVFTQLAKAMGIRYKFEYQSVAEIQAEMKKLIPIYHEIDFDFELHGVAWKIDKLASCDSTKSKSQLLGLDWTAVENKSMLVSNSIRSWFQRFLEEKDLSQ